MSERQKEVNCSAVLLFMQVRVCMYDYVRHYFTMYGHVLLCMAMYCYVLLYMAVWLCGYMAMYAWTCSSMYAIQYHA